MEIPWLLNDEDSPLSELPGVESLDAGRRGRLFGHPLDAGLQAAIAKMAEI